MERSNASLSQEDWSWVDYHIQQKRDSLHKIEEELELDLSKSLKEQDPIIKLNHLDRKKRKNVDDLHDYFKSSKGYKKSVYIKDFEELNNDMLYHVQEIFFKLHQGPGMNDLARTFSSFLVVEVDKRNLNPLK
ncbi:hypothetical protein Tco_1257866 [Tanacetum coccineum]